MRNYKQLAVWRALKRKPGQTRAEILAGLRWKSLDVLSNILYRLRVAGCIRKEGNTWGVRWYATDKRPEDGRGLEEGSQAVVRKMHKHWQANLILAAQAKGIMLKRYPVRQPKPGIALEQCWGFMPISGGFASSDDVSCNQPKPAHQRACCVGTAEESEAA